MAIRKEWYCGFFRDIALDLWMGAFPAEVTLEEVDALERLFELDGPSTLLDVPCGPGRHSLELASRGHDVRALDLSAEAVARLEESARARGLTIETRVADMREIPWSACCDGAFCLGNSFGYLDRDETPAFLRAVAGALKPGGRFLMDSATVAETLLPALDERNWIEVDGITMLIENEYDVSRGVLETEYTFIRESEHSKRKAYHYVFTVAEVRRMLEEQGFEVEEIASSPQLEPYHFGDPRVVFLARRRGA